MDAAHLPARVEYLEQQNKQLRSENDLLRTAIRQQAEEGSRLMNFYTAFRFWQENGCPGPGDKTHGAMAKAYSAMQQA